jgi:purine-binding chemotaxis protein CheW
MSRPEAPAARNGGRPVALAAAEENEFLLFRLDRELFAFSVEGVREIVDFKSITRVPEAPSFMVGVINLRGRVVPVVDLRVKFGLAAGEKTIDTRVIIVEVEHPGETAILGVLVDAVSAVRDLPPAEIGPPPELGAGVPDSFILGVARYKNDFVLILAMDKVLAHEELTGK